MKSPEQRILAEIDHIRRKVRRPVVLALDGASGAGKSTIAGRLTHLTNVAFVQLDDFYQTSIPELVLLEKPVAERLKAVFDWARIRSEALEPLRAGRPGRWRGFDFGGGLGESGMYSLKKQVTEVAPAPTILVEGTYSASPPLRDLVDITVLVHVPLPVRHSRTMARGEDRDFLARWHQMWDEVETYYFESVCPPESFDLLVQNDN